jgi:Ca2+-binding RTX toxin-like protein
LSPTQQQALYIWGTAANDTITINPGNSSGSVSVTMNRVSKGTFGSSTQPISRIIAHGNAGNDAITVSASVTTPAWLYGDDGNDNLSGGAGATYLFGGTGTDTLFGGKGRSILNGGAGGDTLTGSTGDAVLIGGTTSYDANDAALLAILNEWNSTGTYATRAGHVSGGTGGLNGSYYFKLGTVLNDNIKVSVIGSATASDLFFQSVGDTISGQHSGELPPISV